MGSTETENVNVQYNTFVGVSVHTRHLLLSDTLCLWMNFSVLLSACKNECVCVFVLELLHTCIFAKCVVLSLLCIWLCVVVCTSVMCCNGVVGEKHTDSEDPSQWQRQPLLPDEQRSDWWERGTPPPPPPTCSLAHFPSITLYSLAIYPFIPHFIESVSLTSISIFQRLSVHLPLTLVILLLFLAVTCSFALHFSPVSLSFLSHFTHLQSLSLSTHVCTSLSIFESFGTDISTALPWM